MARKRKAEPPKPKVGIKQESSSEEVEEEIEEEMEEEEVEAEEEEEEGEEEEEEEEEEEGEEDAEQSSSSEESSSSSSSSEESEEEDEDNYENDDEATKRQKLRKLIEPFRKEQIMNILKDAALTDPSILSRITQKADSDPNHRKIFVHGMGYDATQDLFRKAFQSFGEMEECSLTIDKTTGLSKGYGFVMFKTRSAAKKALKNPQKMIGKRLASCQLAAKGTTLTAAGGNSGEANNRKIFVGNVGPHISPEKLRSFFESFGEIEEGPTGLDPMTNKPRGYVFFVYKSEAGLNNSLREPTKNFEGCRLACRKFLDGQNYTNKNTTVNAVGNSSNNNQKQGNVGNVMPTNPVIPAVYGSAQNMNSGGGLASNFNQPGFGSSGVMGALGGNYGINSISPSVIGSYGFGIQAALQGGLGSLRPTIATAPGSATSSRRGPSDTGMMLPYAPRSSGY